MREIRDTAKFGTHTIFAPWSCRDSSALPAKRVCVPNFARTLILGLGLLLAPRPSQAAVRVCGTMVSSGPQVAATEVIARQTAMAMWGAKALAATKSAGASAISPPAWRLAISKSVACTRVDQGRFACQATATPCFIRQVPPPALKPLIKGKPVIET